MKKASIEVEEDLNKEDLESKEKTKKSKRLRTKIVLIISLIAIVVAYIYGRGNYLEIKGIGENYLSIYKTDMIYTCITFIINFVFLYLAFYLTNKTIKKGLKVFFDDEKKEMPRFPNKSVCFIIALIGSALSSRMLLNNILLCFSGSKFGMTHPIFNLDISFFVFIKPLIQFILVYLLVVVIATLAYAIVYSLIVLNISFDGVSRESITKCDLVGKIGSRIKIIAFLLALIIIAFMVLNIGNEKFMNIELPDGTEYSLFGAGNADITIKIAGYLILAVLIVISILKAYKGLKEKSTRRVLGHIMVVPIYLIVLAVVLALYQVIFIGSNDLDKNEKYINENIEKTKQAYGITNENLSVKNINYSGTITENEINENKDLLDNIAIVSKDKVLQDLSSSQTVRDYYTFKNTQIASYNVEGKDRLVFLTPREISSKDATYSNMTYQYTHGYGTVVTMAGMTDEYGNLIHIQKEFENSTNDPIYIKEPRIYFGLETNSAIVINSKKTELDYPTTQSLENKEYTYTGNAGLTLNLLDRIILGIKEGDMNLAFSGTLTQNSKIITNRNILNRVKTVMPYLIYDENPYMVVDDDGNLIWVVDVYTISNEYPYAQKIDLKADKQINYIRNSAKVLINAYDGSVKFYITDRTDPIIMAYNKMYPNVFLSSEEIPSDISKHFIYPQYLYDIQTEIIEKYHNVEPETIYRANNIWEVASKQNGGRTVKMDSYYTMVNDNKEQVGLVIPYSGYGKQNLTSYMIGTTENGQNKLSVYEFTEDANVLSPLQLEAQINQDDTIASEIASLNVSGTSISKDLIVVPVNNTLLYVETYYQQYINESNQKPTLKRVVVASGNKVAIGDNLQDALENLSSKAAFIDVENGETIESLIDAIIRANENLKDSSKNNDWTLFGSDMKDLTNLVDQLKEALKEKEEKEETKNEINTTAQANDVII